MPKTKLPTKLSEIAQKLKAGGYRLRVACRPAGSHLYQGQLIYMSDGHAWTAQAQAGSFSAIVDWAMEIVRYHE